MLAASLNMSPWEGNVSIVQQQPGLNLGNFDFDISSDNVTVADTYVNDIDDQILREASSP